MASESRNTLKIFENLYIFRQAYDFFLTQYYGSHESFRKDCSNFDVYFAFKNAHPYSTKNN